MYIYIYIYNIYISSCFWFTPETEKQDGNKFIILN